MNVRQRDMYTVYVCANWIGTGMDLLYENEIIPWHPPHGKVKNIKQIFE